mgnify:CR=1 FL=1
MYWQTVWGIRPINIATGWALEPNNIQSVEEIQHPHLQEELTQSESQLGAPKQKAKAVIVIREEILVLIMIASGCHMKYMWTPWGRLLREPKENHEV